MREPPRHVVGKRDAGNMTCSCRGGDELCPLCRDGLFAQLRGAAACRGENWAASVGKRRPMLNARPWPRYEGRAADLARSKVADLTRDPQLREQLAVELATWAARRWNT